ncbi:expansin EXLX1 family cellulose-binding protein [Cryptosporangium aurantiacum]|uniref:expansin EXLX1 family cellulose-binding protein n=1 Tax=Cryptosporangium aurantiacum TaxID=134849 RepID=UPI0015B7AD01|nr:expansin EXLX1 family cellulose-binding protein [Cryptosporangium aurantiacum]
MTALDPNAQQQQHKGRRRRPQGWLRWGAPALIGVAVLASVILLVGAFKGLSEAACAMEPRALRAALPAAVPQPGDSRSGTSTFFDLAASGGSGCSYDGPPADGMYLALGFDEFSGGAACGTYFNITGPNGNTVRVQVIDACAPCAPGQIDLSEKAFSQLADPDAGIIPVTYRAVANPAVPGPLKFKVEEATPYYLALLPINHGNQLTKVEVDGGNGWQTTSRRGDGYFTADAAGGGPFRIRVTDLQGHVTTVSGVNLSSGSTASTGVYMYSGSGGGTPTTKKSKSPSPSVTPTPKRTLTLPPAIAATDAPNQPAAGRPDATSSVVAEPQQC